jgi:hypothetical protein
VTGKKLTKRSDKMDGASAEKNFLKEHFFRRPAITQAMPGSFAIMEQNAKMNRTR